MKIVLIASFLSFDCINFVLIKTVDPIIKTQLIMHTRLPRKKNKLSIIFYPAIYLSGTMFSCYTVTVESSTGLIKAGKLFKSVLTGNR
jgi:hypothetical protein